VSNYALNEIADVIRGVTFSKAEGSIMSAPDKTPVIRAGSIQQSLLVDEGQIWVPSEKVKKSQYIRKDDIVMCTSSGSSDLVGKCAKSVSDWDGSFGAFCVGIRPKKQVCDSSYLYHFLRSPKFKNWTKTSSGANIKNIRISELSNFEIPLPPLTEQKRIATILDKADVIRRKRQQAIQLADEFLRSVFLEMFGDPVTNSKGWDTKKIKDGVISISAGWSANGADYPCGDNELGVLKISAVTAGIFKPTENKYVEKKIIPENKKLIHPMKGDLLFSRANTRELVAATCIVLEDRMDVFLPDKLWKIETDSTVLLPEFLNYLVWQPRFKDILTSQATGTSGSMLNISKAKFENTIAIYPDVKSQEIFANIYWKVQKTLKNINKSGASMRDLFSALSQKSFAGEI
jgi:type I restriction enzyme S subunit